MSFVFSVNNSYSGTTGATSSPKMFYDFKTFMKANGFTVTQSGDGLSAYSSSGDVITGGSSGAGGFGNNKAWFVLRETAAFAGYNREYLFYNSSNSTYSIIYSHQGFLSGNGNGFNAGGTGNVSAILPPVALDMVYLSGGNYVSQAVFRDSYAIGNYVDATYHASGTWYGNFCIETSTGSWYLFTINGGASPNIIMFNCHDALTNVESLNKDPSVNTAYGEGGAGMNFNLFNGQTITTNKYNCSWYNKKIFADRTQSINDPTIKLINNTAGIVPNAYSYQIYSSPITGNDWLTPIFWLEPTGYQNGHIIGMSTLFRSQLPARSIPNLVNDSSGYWLSFVSNPTTYGWSGFCLAWNGSAISS